jgi:uncharacterized protein (DUF1330 family)
MPAYFIANARITDPVAYEDYKRLASVAVDAYHGRYCVRGGPIEVLEGDWQPDRLIVLEFPTLTQARAFYDSPQYRAARAARADAAVMRAVLVDASDLPTPSCTTDPLSPPLAQGEGAKTRPTQER